VTSCQGNSSPEEQGQDLPDGGEVPFHQERSHVRRDAGVVEHDQDLGSDLLDAEVHER
jgi:hypothetical protein